MQKCPITFLNEIYLHEDKYSVTTNTSLRSNGQFFPRSDYGVTPKDYIHIIS